ncbi:MAG: pilin [Candidatus Gracilibacteria bacterium]|jgi:hypothetical protein
MKKITITILTGIILFSVVQPTFAAGTTILPSGVDDFSDSACITILDDVNSDEEKREKYKNSICYGITAEPCWEEVLACGIKTGDMHLWMLPYYVTRLIEFAIGIAGIISVLFTILGGYFYAWGGLTEDKEKGKKTVMYALIGLALSAFAWILVNIVQTTLTA